VVKTPGGIDTVAPDPGTEFPFQLAGLFHDPPRATWVAPEPLQVGTWSRVPPGGGIGVAVGVPATRVGVRVGVEVFVGIGVAVGRVGIGEFVAVGGIGDRVDVGDAILVGHVVGLDVGVNVGGLGVGRPCPGFGALTPETGTFTCPTATAAVTEVMLSAN